MEVHRCIAWTLTSKNLSLNKEDNVRTIKSYSHVKMVVSLEQFKSPKARRITFAWGNQERLRKSGSHRDRGWRENASWGDGAGCAEA